MSFTVSKSKRSVVKLIIAVLVVCIALAFFFIAFGSRRTGGIPDPPNPMKIFDAGNFQVWLLSKADVTPDAEWPVQAYFPDLAREINPVRDSLNSGKWFCVTALLSDSDRNYGISHMSPFSEIEKQQDKYVLQILLGPQARAERRKLLVYIASATDESRLQVSSGKVRLP